uniref:NACHT domain-containing protein n=1 Tax=Cyprinus carpio carpio TaxID=630221 RepID=A0A8C1AJ44_CYPCA
MASNLQENVLQDQTIMNNQSTESCSSLGVEETPKEEIRTLKSLLQESLRKRYEDTLKAPDEIPLKMYVSSRTHLDGQIVHEMRELERPYNEDIKDENVINYDDLLKPRSSTGGRIRRIMMRGISGCGKTTAVRKFVSDWAHGRTHQHIDFVFPLHLCELNILHDKKLSLIEHLDLLFPKLLKPETLEGSQILFIWDGLGEFRFTLKFKRTKTCTDPVTPVSVGCMLVNLLKGNLLPSAQILVTSRLKDAGLIPPEYIQRVVELHGLDDLQWEELIRSEVRDQNVAARAIVHVKSSRSLYIMRSLPFFCQMASTVLEELFSNCCNTDPPLTLTEMFTHFLLIQMKRHVEKSAKSSTEEILKLGELAWHMLEKNTLTFMEKDQKETNTDPLLPVKLSEDWPMFFRKQHLMGLGKMYRFTHPCVQEFLAALYVAVHYEPSKGNVMSFTLAEKAKMLLSPTDVPPDMHRRAVDRALRSKTGQLDIFLLFLLGICAGPSNKLLSCFFQNTSLRVRTEDVVKNILQKIKAKPLFEISVNLSRCLEELDVALPVVQNRGPVEFQMDEDVHVTPSEWSHIATTLLTSEDSSLTFDVSKYAKVDEAIMRLLPVIKISRVLRLDEATDLSWALIASALRSPANRIREINIEKNALSYINLSVLSVGMSSPNCKVEALRTPYFGYRKDGDHLLSGILLNPTHLRELKLLNSFRKNDRTVESISQILMDPDCRLENLTLQGIETLESCKILAAALCSSSCRLQELDLRRCYWSSEDQALQLLSEAFRHPNFKVTVLSQLDVDSLETLASVLGSCSLRSLDLSMCGLTDSSVGLLSAGLSNPGCKLEILRMTHCSITEAGAACLARALSSNPSHMREIDLSINPVKGPGFDQLRSVLEDPATRLEKLIVDGLEEQRDMETLRQYACQLTWDPNTASSSVQVSEEDKALVKYRRNPEPVPHHKERFINQNQIMSREGLSGRHFFQLEWFGRCIALHGGVEMRLPDCSPWRVGVYLDWAAGTLSLYDTTGDKAELIHTFHAKFTQPLFLLVSITAGVKILPDMPPPVCVHDHDPWDMFRCYNDCKGCNGSKA